MRCISRMFLLCLIFVFLLPSMVVAETEMNSTATTSSAELEYNGVNRKNSFMDRESYESKIYTLNQKMKKLQEYAVQVGNDSLARQIHSDYNLLNVTLSTLKNSWKKPNTKEYSKILRSLDEFYIEHADEFDKLIMKYEEIINDYSLKLPAFKEKASASLLADSTQLILNTPVDVKLTAGQYRIYSFTPSTTKPYRIFTGPYGGTGFDNDTVIELYSDAGLTKLLKSGDDNAGGVTSGFSEVIMTLSKDVTYYVKLRHYSSSGAVEARLLVQLYQSFVSITDPVTVNISPRESQIFEFKPTASNIYTLFTTELYAGRYSDSEIQVFSDATLSNLIAYNNGENASASFSELHMKMEGGKKYYIQLQNTSSTDILYVRFSIIVSPKNYGELIADAPVNVNVDLGNVKVFEFTPDVTGKYRFNTGPYSGKYAYGDTVLYLYEDANLTQQLAFGDDYYGYYDRYFYSEIVYKLNAGTKYYIQVAGYNGKSVSASLTVRKDQTKYVYDDNGRLVEVYLSSGQKYDDDGETINSYLPSGGKRHYVYDRNGNLIKVEYIELF